ncbi:MAG: glycosyltransferase [Rickettsiales bacterium]|nr:glycosyltransferase [Rickettsiales bacterium]
MKILHIIYSPGKGGSEQVFINYINALNARKHNSYSITNYNFCYNEKISNLCADYLTIKFRNFTNISTILRVRKFIRKNQIDIIICHNGRAMKIAKLSAFKLAPIVAINHLFDNVKHSRKCDAVFCMTDYFKEFLIRKKHNEKKIYIVPNFLNSLPLKKYKQRKLKSTPILGMLNRMDENKANHIFLEACKINKKKNFKAILGGEGPEKNNLQKYIQDNNLDNKITMLGWVSDEQKEDFYSKIDILCISSIYETFSMVALEAMARGIPIIATKCHGPEAIIKHKYDGLLCEVNNAEDMSKQISYLLDEPEIYKIMSKNAYKTSGYYYSKNIASIIEDNLQKIIKYKKNVKKIKAKNP